MKNKIKLFLTIILLALSLTQDKVEAQNGPEDPQFTMTVRNIRTSPDPGNPNRDSILLFDVYLLQINQGQPGINDFEYANGQFSWSFNKAIRGNGTLKLGIVRSECELPDALRPPSFRVDTANGQLDMSGNLPDPSVNFFIKGTFPGTKILSVKLTTSEISFPYVPLNIKFRYGAGFRTFVAYFKPFAQGIDSIENPSAQELQNLKDTVILSGGMANSIYIIEEGGFVMPVELISFIANVNKNNVTLNWSTNSETNNHGFDIERALVNSNEWVKAGNVEGNGTTTETRKYSFTERLSSGHYTYRLKQIDFNGGVNYHTLNNEVIVGLPSNYALSQNYPNPFNPTTKIDFELPQDGNISIILYDISGREVSKLVNEVKAAGYYTVQLNASNLASGMYFYRITAGNFVSTKKMVVLK